MSFKKRGNNKWTDAPHYIMGTSTDTITTLPADLYADGNNATVGLKGNMEQSSTPTPTTPIQPQETGERTGNLLFVPTTGSTTSPFIVSYTNNSSKFILNKDITSNNVSVSVLCNIVLNAGTYTIKIQGLNSAGNNLDRIYLVDSNSTIILNNIVDNTPAQFTIVETTTIEKIAFVAAASSTYSNKAVMIMLNTGSTALPYEPYGYKIPISSANTTTPVYLGEVQTTRKIKKLVLTGEEAWHSSSKYTGAMYAYLSQFPGIVANSPIYCSHLIAVGSISQYQRGTGFCDMSSVNLWIFDTTTSSADFKTYLQQQYAAGTPVIIWYVLAEPETAVVNEPLRKIDDYADEVSGITIPTITGANTIDVETTLKPSEVSVNYKGWHPITDVHRFNGTSWD